MAFCPKALLFIGGVGSIAGVIIGVGLISAGLVWSSASEGQFLRGAISGMAMIAIAIKLPDGLSSLGRAMLENVKTRWRSTNSHSH